MTTTMKKKSFKHGEMIVIKHREKDEKKDRHVAARVVAYIAERGRLNVFTQGRLMWIDVDRYVCPADKTESLARGSVATLKSNMSELAASVTETKKPVITENHERALAIVRNNPGSSVEFVSDLLGKATPATKLMLEQLEGAGLIRRDGGATAGTHVFTATTAGDNHKPGSLRPGGKIPRLKADKSGEVAVSKKERVLTLLKNKSLSVNQIAELTGAAPSYIRGVRERASKTMDVPEKGTVKRAVYDELRRGASLSQVSEKCKVTVSYAYQVRQQMINAKII